MLRFKLPFKKINKILLLIAFVSLAYKRGHFSGTLIPGPFQILFVLSLILTAIYLLKDHKIKDFFSSVPLKIRLAVGCMFFSILLGWSIGTFFVGIPNTIHTVLDFGTFSMSLIIFILVLFYTKNDEKYAKWYLYALFIPNFYIFYYFVTHGFVGYWGVLNDQSLVGLLDPNMHSKVLLIPTLFFISIVLFYLQNKKWYPVFGFVILSSIFSMLIFWTVSRGSALSLIAGAILIWILSSIREFTWRKLLWGGLIILIILSLGYICIPQGSKKEFQTKIVNTGSLPDSVSGNTSGIVNDPSITMMELSSNPRSEVRLFEWSFFLKYALLHPFGIGPSSSSLDYQGEGNTYLQLRPGNTYLQVWLWGGLLGLASFLYLLWSAFVALWLRWKRNFDTRALALLGILFALSISITFDASLYFYWFFIILALALQRNDLSDEQTTVWANSDEQLNKKTGKLVSVIIPAYNIEKYLSRTIESVIRQTYQNLEIVIVNDGSTDNTEEIIQEYAKKDKRIVIINQPNKGLPAARNTGFGLAKGEYLCIIDADDVMLPEKIERQYNFLESNMSGDIAYSKVFYFLDNINDIYIRDLSTKSGEGVYQELLKRGNFISPNAVLLRRGVFDRLGGFDESLRSSEDFDYWLSLSHQGVNFLHQDEYLTFCRCRKDSMTSNGVTMYSTCIAVYDKYIDLSKNKYLLYLKYPKYLKSKILLYFSVLRMPHLDNKDISTGHKKYSRPSFYVNKAYVLFKKIKFVSTFKKIDDYKLKNCLIYNESHKV